MYKEKNVSEIVFACDLDNTLFHTYRDRRQGDTVVETLHGRPQTYMSRTVLAILPLLIREVVFVPVTSRSVAQYERIVWPSGCAPKTAILSNGGTLLVDGKKSRRWEQQMKREIAPYVADILRAVHHLSLAREVTSCRLVDDAFAAAAYVDRDAARRALAEFAAEPALMWFRSGRKVFGMPPAAAKEAGLARFLEETAPNAFLICAGDSSLDAGMLELADLALRPMDAAGEPFDDYVARSALMTVVRKKRRKR